VTSDHNVPLEDILEAAEAAVAAEEEEAPSTLVLALGAAAVLLTIAAIVLGLATWGGPGTEQRALALAVTPSESPDDYAGRLSVEDASVTFHDTIFGTRELRAQGRLRNSGDRVVAGATLVLTVKHLFGDEVYEYTFRPVTPFADGVGNAGPLLARTERHFTYRVPDIPEDLSSRVVRISWRAKDIVFHEELPIPAQMPTADTAA